MWKCPVGMGELHHCVFLTLNPPEEAARCQCGCSTHQKGKRSTDVIMLSWPGKWQWFCCKMPLKEDLTYTKIV